MVGIKRGSCLTNKDLKKKKKRQEVSTFTVAISCEYCVLFSILEKVTDGCSCLYILEFSFYWILIVIIFEILIQFQFCQS